MGFKDAEWAYSVKLPTAQKVVLVAIAHATDDRTHQTYRSQKTIAGMVGMAVSTVNRSIGILEELGLVNRKARRGIGGYRTTDLITITTAYVPETNVGETNVGDTNMRDSTRLHAPQADPTSQSRIAIDHSEDHSEDHPERRSRPISKEITNTRGTRLAKEWLPTPESVSRIAIDAPDINHDAEHPTFIDYWIAQPGAKGVKTDWDATWRNWMRRKQTDQRGRKTLRLGGTAAERAFAVTEELRRQMPTPTPPRVDPNPTCAKHDGYPDTRISPCAACIREEKAVA